MPRQEGCHVIFYQTWVEEGVEDWKASNGGLQFYVCGGNVGYWQYLSTRAALLVGL